MRRQGREENTAIQLPFGGGKEFENIEAELQVCSKSSNI